MPGTAIQAGISSISSERQVGKKHPRDKLLEMFIPGNRHRQASDAKVVTTIMTKSVI